MLRVFLITGLFLLSSISWAQQLKIGIIADCQYCDCEYNQEWDNSYREAPARLQQAVDTFNSNKVDLVFHLGDFIDRDYSSYETVMPIMQTLTMQYYFVLGNHDFSVADSMKSKVYKELKLDKPYYTVNKGDWLFIVLDGTEISTYHSIDSLAMAHAKSVMATYKSNGRSQAEPWNGGISQTQMDWLDRQLMRADRNKQKAIVMCHFPVLPEGEVNLWNDAELVDILSSHKSVKAYFNGHHHPGNYEKAKGKHYVTFQGMVRSKDRNSFSIVNLTSEKIEIEGYGREPDRILSIK